MRRMNDRAKTNEEIPEMDERGGLYTPNHIPVETRWIHLIISGGLILYAAIGLLVDDIYLPGKRRGGLHFHGISAWVMAFAFAMACCNLLSVIVDHYDRRNNETNYRLFAKVTSLLGILLFIAAAVVGLWTGTAGKH